MRGLWLAAVLFPLLLSCAVVPALLEQEPAASGLDRKAWQARRELRVLIWNLGFGGLGEGAEFYPDGGHRFIPSSRRQVRRYVQGIGAFLGKAEADLFLLQEAAGPSVLNRRVDLLGEVAARLPGLWLAYSAEVLIALPRVSVGLATLAPGPPLSVERVPLPQENRWQRFHLLVARFPVPAGSGELVLANVHLSAFDRDAELRQRQLAAVTAFLLAESLRGSYVVLGGDWNLLLTPTAFPHTTEERFLGWVHALPSGFPPPGWRLAVDARVPTVRTLERPYVKGQNYTAVIDGFLVSPNVSVRETRTVELGFRFSDHQPVLLHLRLD